ncbi:GNAT family N-acetyltransferase [Marixanthomonas spongiae]|uniref:GNAT family N-acetyltransferase n=1 Tax=Marixanthomonas spongiae TaxID=2174845 RepID=A0A2U0I646_9FLAO|nr:GNAT family N-acetyltransferase [Marixanthomonas spongiae]PVW16583.1 GNAT family N-acetyltransferase [Marixanthomonas spongiae]
MKILQANVKHLDQLIPLFNGYRMFYKQPDDPEKAKVFLKDRFEQNDSVIFMAFTSTGKAVGFTQLYPTFSSVSAQKRHILNDLFILKEHRGNGFGEALLTRAKQFVRDENSKGLTLETETNNPAQYLYERLGWKKDEHLFHYSWEV